MLELNILFKISKVPYMYDAEMGINSVDGRMPGFHDLFNGCPLDVHMIVRRIRLESIPLDDEKQCGEYLYKLYQEKVERRCFPNLHKMRM